MSAISANLVSPPNAFSTTLSSGIASNALTIPLNSVTGLASEGVGVLFTKNANGGVVAGSVEIIHWTGVASLSLTLTDTGDRGLTGSDAGAQAYSASVTFFEVWVTSYYYKSLLDGIASIVVPVKASAAEVNTGTNDTKFATPKALADSTKILDSNQNEVIVKGVTASAVNEVTVTNAATAGIPQIAASGDDANISLNLKGKGTGVPLNNGDPFINMVTSGAQAAFGTASTSFVDSTGATVTIVPTKAVRVHVTVSGRWYVNTGGESIFFRLLIDGVNIQEYDVKNATVSSGIPFCVSGQASLAAGSRVIKLQIRSAGGGTVNADQANVNVIWG